MPARCDKMARQKTVMPPLNYVVGPRGTFQAPPVVRTSVPKLAIAGCRYHKGKSALLWARLERVRPEGLRCYTARRRALPPGGNDVRLVGFLGSPVSIHQRRTYARRKASSRCKLRIASRSFGGTGAVPMR